MSENKIPLTKRELEVLQLLTKGFTSTEVAEELSISSHTVASHKQNMINKTGAKNIVDLTRIAFEARWI